MSGHTCIKFRLPGRQGIHVLSFVFHSVFLCQLHAHTCPLYNALLEVVCCCFPILTLYKHDVCRVTDFHLSSFMFVSAAVSEIRELNQNKKEQKNNSEIDYLRPFLGI